ncbi:MAG: Piwi domain-containing protein [Calothrix sp. MO_167.B12]|nr:Piwi domain-containing protein [Calothrix sp. MO_167.B12]
MSISLNGFKIELSASEFTVYMEEMPHNKGVKPLREKLGEEWFFHWSGGKVYGIPKVPQPKQSFGKPCKVNCSHNLKIIKARINDILPTIFHQYSPLRRDPFTFLAQKKELISSIADELKDLPTLIHKFQITPKLIIEPKIVELRRNEAFIGVFLNIKTHWEILASLSELKNAGINLNDLCVVRRQTQPRQRRLVGKIRCVSENIIYLSESYDNVAEINDSEVWLEASRQSFARCLKTLLGNRYKTFESKRLIQETDLLNGLGMESHLNILGAYLKRYPMQLAPDLKADVCGQIEATNDKTYQTVVSASPVEYCFDSARTKLSSYPWKGIKEYGPFSRDFFSKKSPEILVLFPDTVQGQVENFLRHFQDGISIKNKNFQNGFEEWLEVSQYPGGFGNIFQLVNPKLTLQKISWLANTQKSPAAAYEDAVKQALQNLESQQTKPDAAIIIILDEYAHLKDEKNPFLISKALLLMAGIPVQGIRVPTLSQRRESLQYTLRTLSVALYAKMKGIPWTVIQDLTISDELVIGIGTCELSNSRFSEKQRFVGITTVFRGDGNYLLGNLSDECSYSEYPRVLKKSTLEILHEIKQRNGWLPGDTVRLVFHAARPLKNVDVADIVKECVAEVGSEQIVEFAFLTISQQHPFTLLDKSRPGLKNGSKKGTYAPDRGTIVEIGRYTRLLCTTGAMQVKRPHAPLPKPLLIHLHPQSDYRDLTYLSEQVLKFTALSWRSLLPTRQPVTIYYSELIANLLARLRKIRGWSSALLNSLLRTSKWFL